MADKMGPEYVGREQTYLKHRALRDYVLRWGLKVGSFVSRRGEGKLWYADVMSGPWKAQHERLHDTSIYVGLRALQAAQEQFGFPIGGVFIEKNEQAYHELVQLCETEFADLDIHCFHGRFQDHLGDANRLIGSDPACVFVDPTGWKETTMVHVAAVCDGWRDVLVRVPYEAYRFKTKDDTTISRQLVSFFGIEDESVFRGLDEQQFITLYCERLKQVARMDFSAEMQIPEPRRDATSCWLVVGGRRRDVLDVFRRVEEEVVGREALEVREAAKGNEEAASEPVQESLFAPNEIAEFDRCLRRRQHATAQSLPSLIESIIGDRKHVQFSELWPEIIERHHLSVRGLGDALLRGRGRHYEISGLGERQRVLRDEHRVRMVKPKHRAA